MMTAGANRHDDAVFETNLPLGGRRQGKVRDVYSLPPGTDGTPRLLVVASDRVSAFDVVMPTPIPGKGKLLTEISTAWFTFLRTQGIIEDHLLSTEVPDDAGRSAADRAVLAGRTMTCRAAQVVLRAR